MMSGSRPVSQGRQLSMTGQSFMQGDGKMPSTVGHLRGTPPSGPVGDNTQQTTVPPAGALRPFPPQRMGTGLSSSGRRESMGRRGMAETAETRQQTSLTSTVYSGTAVSGMLAGSLDRSDHLQAEEADSWRGGSTFRCTPGGVNFGPLQFRKLYRMKLLLLNIGTELSRFRLRQPKASNVSVLYSPAAVAAGMSVMLEVEISTTALGRIRDELQVRIRAQTFPCLNNCALFSRVCPIGRAACVFPRACAACACLTKRVFSDF